MSSSLFTIASSGARAAKAALDVTSQNIANVSTEGYVRRSLSLAELASATAFGYTQEVSLSGVRIDGVSRNADLFRQAEVRRTGADAAKAGSELKGLENVEAALEQARLFPAMSSFEASLQRLTANPVDQSMRAQTLEDARTLAHTFNIAAQGLTEVGNGLRFEATDETGQVNLLAGELGRVNLQLARSQNGSSDQVRLLDARDNLLQKLSGYVDLSTTIGANQTVEVRLGGSGGPQLVSGGTVNPFAMTTAGDGTISFTLSGNPVTVSSGSLAGRAQALVAVRDNLLTLDTTANALQTAVNGVQTAGAALDGSAGLPLFTGSGAAGIALNLTSGNQIATAPGGAGAGSRDPANLNALRSALSSADISGQIDAQLFSASSAVAGRKVTSKALDTIAASAKIALSEQAGVDLDQEAVNLIRYQQAFQACGKAMQVASDLFDTILAIR